VIFTNLRGSAFIPSLKEWVFSLCLRAPEIKEDKNLHSIPVIVLTTSNAEKDILEAYDLHANAYVTKPLDFNQFINVVGSIVNFWLGVVQLPTR